MILAVCVDDRLGMSFCGRRQSKDSVVCQKLLELSGGSLRMSDYSARQFEEPVYHGLNYLSGAQNSDWCFVENSDYEDFAKKIEKIVLFRWNRHYPADTHFQFPGKWDLFQSSEFPGSSHEKITMEVYKKCE